MDRAQISAFCEYALGGRHVGGNDPGDPVSTPHSPELRAFCAALLGENMPIWPWQLCRLEYRPGNSALEPQAKAFAALLREIADGIDPPATAMSSQILAAIEAATEFPVVTEADGSRWVDYEWIVARLRGEMV
jgi:hypothetical protein